MWQDVRFGFRALARSPGFLGAVTLSLGLALGANATIFGVVDALWLRPPGTDDPGALVRVFSTTDSSTEGPWSYPEYLDLRNGSSSLQDLAARGRRGAVLQLQDGTSELELVNVVSENFFQMLGVKPALGRLFSTADTASLEREPAVILGHAFWRRRYGGDPSIVGRTITLSREGPLPVTVLGVLPESFRDLDPSADRDLWLPPATWRLLANRTEFERRDYRWFELFGRRRAGRSVGDTQGGISGLAATLAASFPATNRGRGARVVSDLSYRLEVGGVNAFALLALVLLVVTITSVNVANLLLARGASRAREIAVRVSLGASHRRLLRQLAIESMLIGALGTAAGLVIAAALVGVLPAIIGSPPGLRSFIVFAIDGRVLAFTFVVATVTTIAFGVVPSWIAARPDVVPILKGETGLLGRFAGHQRLRGALVAVQVAVAVVVLCSASILSRSFARSSWADLGITRSPLLLAWVTFADLDRPRVEASVDRLRAMPGVRDVAIGWRAPLSLSGGGMAEPVFLADAGLDPNATRPEVKYNAVSPNYFKVMGVRLLSGRVLTDDDERSGEGAIVINESFRKRYFPGGDALGRLIRLGRSAETNHVVVGVVADTVINAIGEQPEPYFYLPFWASRSGEVTFILDSPQGVTSAGAVREALRFIDPRLEPRTVVTMTDLIIYSQSTYRATAVLAGAIALVGLLLTAIGIYGLVSLNIASRTREMGIRLALGARRHEILTLALRGAMLLALAGIVIGLPVALMVTRLLASLLFEISPWDGPAFATALLIVAGCVTIASLVPARRVSRVVPSAALRQP